MTSSIKAGFAALTIAAAAVCTAQQISVDVDGRMVSFPDTNPRMVNGRVMVPLRGVFEEMGAYVNWNPSTRTVTATRGAQDVQLRIGDRTAMLNGSTLNLDVPAMIIGNSTMVPIRFVSEALGAQVGWMASMNRVSIHTNGASGTGTVVNQPRRLRRVVVQDNTVIPVRLDHTLSTLDARKGDKFTATVVMDGDEYATLPRGTKVEGHVAAVRRRTNNQPALLEVEFDRLRFPNGRTVKIDGDLTSMDEKFITRDGNGVMTANTTAASKGDQRMVYAGYGAGAGLLVGLLTKKPLEGAVLGGALGYLLGQVQKDQRQQTTEITLNPGTQMGVRVNRDVAVSWADN